jgi:hypothetical protein
MFVLPDHVCFTFLLLKSLQLMESNFHNWITIYQLSIPFFFGVGAVLYVNYKSYGECRIRKRNCLLSFTSTWIHPWISVGSILFIHLTFFVCCVVFSVLFVIILCLLPNVYCVSGLSILHWPFGLILYAQVKYFLNVVHSYRKRIVHKHEY